MSTIDHKSKCIKYHGRTAVFDPIDARFFNWSGAGFEFRFNGTKASAKIVIGDVNEPVPAENDRAYLGVFVDGSIYETARFALNKNCDSYILTEDLPCGEHKVRVVKETEMWYGRAGLVEITCDGEFLPLTDDKSKKIEFIGDSLTCGYGNICSNGSPDFSTREENFSNTFAAISSRILDCDISVVAASGNGFFHDYGCNTVNLIPELYEYTDKVFSGHLGIEPEKWNFKKDKCDAVVIKLGPNDSQYCFMADLPETERTEEIKAERKKAFEEAAYRFFMRIIEVRPDIPILFIYDEDLSLKAECVSAAMKTGKVETFAYPSKKEYEGVGANGHYSAYTHARVAKILAEKLKEML